MARKLTPADAAELLTLAATFDRRTVGVTDAVAWADALYDLEPADCAEAIRLHFRETDMWLMPAHVRQRVKYLREIRADRLYDVELRREIASGKEVDRDRMRELAEQAIDELHTKLGETKPTRQQRDAVSVRCPYCAARPGSPCINGATEKERKLPHPSRVAALAS